MEEQGVGGMKRVPRLDQPPQLALWPPLHHAQRKAVGKAVAASEQHHSSLIEGLVRSPATKHTSVAAIRHRPMHMPLSMLCLVGQH